MRLHINQLNSNSLKVITASESFTALPNQSRDLEKVITLPSGSNVQTVITNVKTGYVRTVTCTDRGYSVSGTQLTAWFSLGSTDSVNRDVSIEVICLYK